MLSLSNDNNNISTKAIVTRISTEYSLVSDFLYQHRVAFDGAVSEVEILDTSNCAVSNECHKVAFSVNTKISVTANKRLDGAASIRLKLEARIANVEIDGQT